MKRSNIIGIIAAAVVIIVSVVLISWYLRRSTPTLIQGTVECTTYKASSKVPGRIDDMKVEQGDRVEKGQLLYTLSTPELEAKLQQAEAVKSAAAALDQAAIAGARIQQIEAAMNMWEKAQAGLELARKTYERVKNLYEQGVVPEQKMDEASANYKAMEATALAAKAQYNLAMDGARKEDKEAAAARVRQAEGAVSEVESYISDAMVYSPVTGEVSTIIAEQGELVGSGYPVVAILDMSDMWVTFNIKETLLPAIRVGTRMSGYVPALGYDVEFEVTYIAVQADFATWSATRTQGGFDIRTFAIKAKAVTEA
ncbi:HlyD family secretion protein, partial [Alistipes finegoldii]|uniref:HlyD family secretion protein n=1 Tax=Alistipes finegoldii TaxID=214856 RepID=UPI003AB0ED23